MSQSSEGERREIYVSAKLDDYGLDPESFRIYGRIARRCGNDPTKRAFDSIPNLSQSLQIGINTVRRKLKLLEDLRFIFRERRPGQTDRFGIYPASCWQKKGGHEIVSTNENVRGKRSRNRKGSGHEIVRGVVTESLDEGFHSEGFPIKDSDAFASPNIIFKRETETEAERTTREFNERYNPGYKKVKEQNI